MKTEHKSLRITQQAQRRKQPTKCNKFRLLIISLIFLIQFCMFRATNSPILRSTFWLYIQLLVQFTDIAADRWQGWDGVPLVILSKCEILYLSRKELSFSGSTKKDAHKKIFSRRERKQWHIGENNVHKRSSLFCKIRNISFTGEASETAPFYALHMLWDVGYFPPILVILEYSVVTILHIIEKEPLNEWFATHNSVQIRVAVISFSQNSGYVYCLATDI